MAHELVGHFHARCCESCVPQDSHGRGCVVTLRRTPQDWLGARITLVTCSTVRRRPAPLPTDTPCTVLLHRGQPNADGRLFVLRCVVIWPRCTRHTCCQHQLRALGPRAEDELWGALGIAQKGPC